MSKTESTPVPMQPVVATPVTVIYGLNDDLTLVMANVVTTAGIVAQWGMTDKQCEMHIRELGKYRALLRHEAKQENLQ